MHIARQSQEFVVVDSTRWLSYIFATVRFVLIFFTLAKHEWKGRFAPS
jgi:hypothetical protein